MNQPTWTEDERLQIVRTQAQIWASNAVRLAGRDATLNATFRAGETPETRRRKIEAAETAAAVAASILAKLDAPVPELRPRIFLRRARPGLAGYHYNQEAADREVRRIVQHITGEHPLSYRRHKPASEASAAE